MNVIIIISFKNYLRANVSGLLQLGPLGIDTTDALLSV